MEKSEFPIVGIGASAGGIEEPGLAIVIVTHLPPERESLLHEVVRHLTTCFAIS
jgi:two-component system, chemotaxis family, CheB/CheR fusion protein